MAAVASRTIPAFSTIKPMSNSKPTETKNSVTKMSRNVRLSAITCRVNTLPDSERPAINAPASYDNPIQ